MWIYQSRSRQNDPTNNYYPNPVNVETPQDLLAAVAYDHVAAEYKSYKRKNENYLQSDCLMMDVDNAPAKGAPDLPPSEWVDLDRIAADLPGVKFFAVTSRNHMKEKDGRPARPKFHCYFPLSAPIRDAQEYRRLKVDLQQICPYFDANATDAARFFFGNPKAEGWYTAGDLTVDAFIIQSRASRPSKSTEEPARAPRPSTSPRTTPSTMTTVDNGLWDLREIVAAIDPARLGYEEWVKVGMAMHRYPDTFTVDDWDAWSQADQRYKPRDCARRWNGFKDGPGGVGAQYLIDLAKAHGWTPPARQPRTREIPPPPEPPAYMTRTTAPSIVELSDPEPVPTEAPDEPVAPPQMQKKPKFTYSAAGAYIADGGYDGDIAYFKEYQDRKTGFKQLDRYLTLYPGLAVLGGASSLGKTTFTVNLIDRLLARGETVLYFTLEQLQIELITKSVARIVKEQSPNTIITNQDIKRGANTPDVMAARAQYTRLAEKLFYIPGDFRMTAQDITATVEAFRKEHGDVKPVVVVDYLQIVAPPYGFRGGIREATDENLKAFKDMQKRNGLFVLIISSFNRSSNLSPVSYESFKETSMIEFTCDYVWGLQLAILDAENSDFYSSTGPRQGRRATTDEERYAMINAAQQQTPKKVEFVSLKNRNGRQFWKAFFDYYPASDLFVEEARYTPQITNSTYTPI